MGRWTGRTQSRVTEAFERAGIDGEAKALLTDFRQLFEDKMRLPEDVCAALRERLVFGRGERLGELRTDGSTTYTKAGVARIFDGCVQKNPTLEAYDPAFQGLMQRWQGLIARHSNALYALNKEAKAMER